MSRSLASLPVRLPIPQAREATRLTARSRAIAAVRDTSQRRAVLSSDVVTIRVPSGLNAALYTTPPWPAREAISRPVATSHRRAVLSYDAVATLVPSALNDALLTDFSWPMKEAITRPVAASHR